MITTPATANAPAFIPPPLAPRNPRFIPAPVELVQLAGVWRPGPMEMGWSAEQKHDGIRAAWIDGALYSREGLPLDLPHVAAELATLEHRFGRPMMFDGEYVEPGGYLDTLAWLSSRGKRAAAGTFHLFDAVPLDQWRRDDCQQPLTARRAAIAACWGDWRPEHVRRVTSVAVRSQAAVEMLARAVWAQGLEGLVIKRDDSLYRRRRSGDWAKLKRALRLSGVVTEILNDGASARVEIGGRKVRVSVAPGLRHTLAVEMMITVAAMEWTKTGALRNGCAVAIGKGD